MAHAAVLFKNVTIISFPLFGERNERIVRGKKRGSTTMKKKDSFRKKIFL